MTIDEARKVLALWDDPLLGESEEKAIEALRAALVELDRLRQQALVKVGTVVMELQDMRIEVDRLRKDAERYGWLRGGPEIPPHSTRWPRWEVRYWDGRYWQTLFSDNLDTAIDAEISNETPNNSEAATLRAEVERLREKQHQWLP